MYPLNQYSVTLIIILCALSLLTQSSLSTSPKKGFTDLAAQRCFCKLQGEVDDCSCTVENVDTFNNERIHPLLQSLLVKDYFKYFKVNLEKPCKFWADDDRCPSIACAVEPCPEENVPSGLKSGIPSPAQQTDAETGEASIDPSAKYTESAEGSDKCEEEKEELLNNEKFGKVDTTISEESRAAFEDWRQHDDAEDNFCQLEDERSLDSVYVDLLINPERYTGYKGDSAHRIWRSIYEENCFKPDDPMMRNDYAAHMKAGRDVFTTDSTGSLDMCLEKRVFYRVVSGLHTSINMHLSALNLIEGSDSPFGGVPKFGPNVEEFKRRFDSETTRGKGPQWLKNLYFIYLVELRALAKAAPYLEKELYYTGNSKEDEATVATMKHFLNTIRTFNQHFDESQLFKGYEKEETAQLKEEFRNHFLNVSRIMDCVGCIKCRVWGKLQVQGLGTALKILFSGKFSADIPPVTSPSFSLRRTEIVSLLNAFGRLSNSIHHLDTFRKMLT